MRSIDTRTRPDGERWRMLHEFPPVRGLTVAVFEPMSDPDTVNLVILDSFEGVSVVAELDRTDPSARARAITLGETVHETLETAELSWMPPWDNPMPKDKAEGV